MTKYKVLNVDLLEFSNIRDIRTQIVSDIKENIKENGFYDARVLSVVPNVFSEENINRNHWKIKKNYKNNRWDGTTGLYIPISFLNKKGCIIQKETNHKGVLNEKLNISTQKKKSIQRKEINENRTNFKMDRWV
ncbi:MAG: hypothetical protein GF317_06140 [Candidatus Lokiarchaeota archaeon]|nr:hypothetical protein [Candidatus Lokiarchaeota archaeon]